MDYCNLSFNSYEHAWLYRAKLTSVVTAYVPPSGPAVFTKDPQQLRGEFITTQLEKSPRGFGFTILGTYVLSAARSPPYEYEQCRCLLLIVSLLRDCGKLLLMRFITSVHLQISYISHYNYAGVSSEVFVNDGRLIPDTLNLVGVVVTWRYDVCLQVAMTSTRNFCRLRMLFLAGQPLATASYAQV